jgi:voltage-gated potassium channel
VVAIVALFVLGTLGFMAILDESWHAALYRTIVSASLTGLDSTPHGLKAETLTILIVLSGVAIFGYFAAQLFDEIAHGVLGGGRRARKRQKMIDQLSHHIILCGYGRVGGRTAEEFRAAGVDYVVLDNSQTAIDAAEKNGDLFILGDGANDDDLLRAGIERARGLVVASDDDADNLYITLSAKAHRPDLTVVAPRRRTRSQSCPRRRRSRRHPVHDRRARDGEPGPAARVAVADVHTRRAGEATSRSRARRELRRTGRR